MALGQYQCLDVREQQRLQRYRNAPIRSRHAASTLVLRTLLGHYLDAPPKNITYNFGNRGKPALAKPFEDSGIEFNSTACRHHGLIAIGHDMALGIDLEYLNRRLRSTRLGERICGEIESCSQAGNPEAARKLLQCWTRKEAWGKALGLGIRYPLAKVPVCMGLSWQNCRIFGSQGSWQLLTIPASQGWLATVVSSGHIDQIEFRTGRIEATGVACIPGCQSIL